MRSSARAGTVSASAPSSQTSPRHLPDIRQRGHYSCGGLPRRPVQGGCPSWGGPPARVDPGGGGGHGPREPGRVGGGGAHGAPPPARGPRKCRSEGRSHGGGRGAGGEGAGGGA